MSEHEPLEPLEPALAELFASERKTHRPEPLARDEVLERVERGLRMAALSGTANSSSAAGFTRVAKLAIATGVTVAAAGGGFAAGRMTAPAPSTAPAILPQLAPSPSIVPGLTIRSIPSSASPGPPPPRPSHVGPPMPASPPTRRPQSDLAREQELIDTARGALARGRHRDALEATERHAQRYPLGALAEEREALAIQALVLTDRVDTARARAERFKSAYPQSIFGPAIERALAPR